MSVLFGAVGIMATIALAGWLLAKICFWRDDE